METNLMNNMKRAHEAPRCSATSKRTGSRCRSPAVKGWNVCRFHGARSGAPSGEANGSYRTGQFTKEAIERRRALSHLIKDAVKGVSDFRNSSSNE